MINNNKKYEKTTSKEIRCNLPIKIILIAISIVALIYSNLYGLEKNISNIIIVTCINLLSIYLVVLVRRNWNLLIIFSAIAWFNYSICMALYIDPMQGGLYTSFSGDEVMTVGINIILIFMLLITIFFPKSIQTTRNNSNFIKNENENAFLVIGVTIILIFILIFGATRPNIVGERGAISPIYEYSLIFFIVGFYYSGNKRRNINIISVLLFLFVIQNLMYGGRVVAIQLILCYFIILFSTKVSPIKILPFVLIGLLIFTSIGTYRANFKLSYNLINEIGKEIINNKFTLDTAYSAYYTSLTFIKVKGMISNIEVLYQFKSYLISLILGSGIIGNSSVQNFTRDYFMQYGGGILPIYLYYYLGWIGIIIPAALVSLYTKMINKSNIINKGYIRCLSVFITCHVFRWYLYSPNGLIRGAGLMLFTFGIAEFVNRITLKQKVNI